MRTYFISILNAKVLVHTIATEVGTVLERHERAGSRFGGQRSSRCGFGIAVTEEVISDDLRI